MAKFGEKLKGIANAVGRFFIRLWTEIVGPFFSRVKKAVTTKENYVTAAAAVKKYLPNPVSLAFLIAMLAVFGYAVVLAVQTNGESMSSWLFYNENDWFMDWFNSMSDSDYPGLYTEWGVLYTPLIYIPLNWLLHLFPGYEFLSATDLQRSQFGVITFFLIFGTIFALFAVLLYRKKNGTPLEKILFIAVMFLSVGMLSVVDRGNVIIFAVFFSAVFLAFYNSKRWWAREIAYISLAIAVCIKLYPVFLGLLILREKNFTGALRCAVYWLILFVAPFLFYGNVAENIIAYFYAVFDFGGVEIPEGYDSHAALQYLAATLSSGEQEFYIPMDAIEGDSSFSFSGTLQILFAFAYNNYETLAVSHKIGMMLIVCGVFFQFFLDKPWKSAMMLALLCICFSPSAYSYAATFMIFPCLMFFNNCNWKNPLHWIYAALFVCMFALFVTPDGTWNVSIYYDLSLENFLERLAMLIMVFLLICEGLFFFVLKAEDGVVWLIRTIRRKQKRRALRHSDVYGK